ncbi:NAD-dependent epimerase/dehydratase family protein [Sphingosinicella rhizophila]|uniref:NAD-dependent epimerase/dehydratase family protein n=1 Tax=Sphingosinicella rhizophila TaxID=3050082 RepID=A0ABU3QAL1_9SPHN|nr:NAD-dependent epimerase/dehydratase family protein [Sphingosinicella sp. GR2756]MDT9600332.1 NAD-dependent epimerase/dehydratase family protein [Sphingosinicella sp. GR2756]
MNPDDKPIILITGAAGNIGGSLATALAADYRIVGLDRSGAKADFPLIEVDFTKDESVAAALARFRQDHGSRIASVIHLVAFFDFSGEDNPLYREVNVEGTRRLLRALQEFEVEQFVYSGTMLVHAPGRPGEAIDENQPIRPGWAYPESKAAAEAVIRAEHGRIPYLLLHLAGLYDERTSVPTLAHQIARIYERDLQSHFYSGSTQVGQSMLHREDMIAAFRRAVDRRTDLPGDTTILIGEPEAIGYGALQDELGYLIHGAADWPTLRLPKPAAAAGAWAQDKIEPIVPDALDQGERPFIKPFMVAMADDHYALDIDRARRLLGWEPKHRLKDALPKMVAALKEDPKGWYEANGLTAPPIMDEAVAAGKHPEDLRSRHEAELRSEHRASRWAHFVNIALGAWLITQPPMIGVEEIPLARAEAILGALIMVFATLSLSWRMAWARWACAGIGALVMAAPFIFWTTNAAAYLSDTLVGALVIGFAICTRPEVGPSALAAQSGPDIPIGWSYNPSSWTQRLPIILLAIVGLQVSRYLAAYQLGHVDGVWEPFFQGSASDPRNGTEEIITSRVSEAWPVSDAAVGGYTYMLEILTGIIGTRARWRTMPWLVLLFGMMIAPLGVVSILFIIIQPIVIGTWSTLALIGAAAMLVQIPYSLDELVATLQFLRRRIKAGRNWMRVLLFGDTDEGEKRTGQDEFDRRPGEVLQEIWSGGVNLPWNLSVAAVIALWLLFTRVTLDASGDMANADHLIGALALTVISLAAAEVTRALRFLLIPLGGALMATALLYGATVPQTGAGLLCGLALILLSIRRGPIGGTYAGWQKLIV